MHAFNERNGSARGISARSFAHPPWSWASSNQELLTTHMHALMISEIGLPGLDDGVGARPSIMRLIIDDNDKMPLTAAVHSGLKIPPMMFSTIKSTFKRVIRDFEDDLHAQAAPWYFDQWIEQNLTQAGDHLDRTLDRVDKLAARAAVIRTHQVFLKTTILLFRCRNVIEELNKRHQIVAEEMILWGWRGAPHQKEFIGHAQARALLDSARASSNLSPQSRANFLENELKVSMWELYKSTSKNLS